MRCPTCDYDNNSTAKFCVSCGSAIQNQQPAPPPFARASVQRHSKLPTIIVVIVVVIIGLGFVLSSGKTPYFAGEYTAGIDIPVGVYEFTFIGLGTMEYYYKNYYEFNDAFDYDFRYNHRLYLINYGDKMIINGASVAFLRQLSKEELQNELGEIGYEFLNMLSTL